jgi:hypothetical protein
MDLRSQLDYFRKEHEDIQRFVEDWEDALKLAASEDDADRLRALAQLRQMETVLLGIREHCRAEQRTVESRLRAHQDDVSRVRLAQEHELLRQLTNDYLRELQFATLSRTGEVARLGIELLEQLRNHIAYETALLKQIEDSSEGEEKVLLRHTQPPE